MLNVDIAVLVNCFMIFLFVVRIRREAETFDVLDSPKWGIYST